MLTFKQSVILLVSIITILAVVAVITGLSPLYWPRQKSSSNHNDAPSSFVAKTNHSSVSMKPQTTIRPKPATKKLLELTSVKLNNTLSTAMNTTLANTTIS